jgi:hypothetical protein
VSSYNKHIENRLEGIREALMATYRSGTTMSAATKGHEREIFVQSFLSRVFPTPYRFGSGDITDTRDNRSGQLDVVIEYPLMPSLPGLLDGGPRLYLAEGVAAVIEVKSDLKKQWREVEASAKAVKKLRRVMDWAKFEGPRGPDEEIPFYAVGFRGWAKLTTLEDHVVGSVADGALCLENGTCCVTHKGTTIQRGATGSFGLYIFICALHTHMNMVTNTGLSPLAYLHDWSKHHKEKA